MFKLLAKTVILFIFIILVSACEPAEIPTPHPAIPATPSTTSLPATPTYTTTPTPTLAIPLDGRGGGLIAFYSERDGNAEIYIMNADGSAETRLTQNQFLDTAPDISPDGSQVVFVSNRDGNEEIYRMSRDGSNIIRLTNAAAQDSYPFWSSDGTKIIFCSKRDDDLTYEVYIMNSDGSDQRRITNNTVSEEWAYMSPDMQKITYAVGPFPQYNLYIMNADGSDPRQILSSDQGAAIPKWSRDGKTIAHNLFAFTAGNIVGEIFLIDADGTSSRQITETGGNSISENPYWSPDGSQIVFQSNRTGNFQIYVMNADGSNQQRLTNHTGNDYWPSWAEVDANRTAPAASNNSLIAFSSDQDGDFEVWVMNADGSDQHNLTINASMDISPAWSPDGSRIAFVSDRDGNDEIYIMNADGSDVRRLTETADASESFPAWSPDGTEISFDSDRDGNWEIYLMASDGSNPRRLTNDPADDWITSWSPDGSQIVFESKRDGNYEIYVMDSDGSNLQRFTENQFQDGFPAWSPDGAQIAFLSRRDGNYEIYVMENDGTNIQQLTDNPAEDSNPDWSPDGEWLAFVSQRDGNDEIYIMKADGRNVHQLTDNGAQNWSPAWQPANAESDRTITWIRTFEGPDYGAFLGLTLTDDGNILAVGATNHLHMPPYSGDALFMKVTLEGDVLWEHTWGGDGYDQADSVVPAGDGGYYIFGETDSYGAGDRDFFLLKITEDGAEEWFKTYGRVRREWPYGMLQLSNGDLLIYGLTESLAGSGRNQYVLRVGLKGEVIWEYTVESSEEEFVIDALETAEGDLVLVVVVGNDAKLEKLDADGSIQWEKRYELPGWQFASQIATTSEGGFLLAGFSMSSNGQADTWLARCTSTGELVWETSFGEAGFDDYANSMITLRDGTYLIGAIANGVLLSRIDEDGNVLWGRSLVGETVYGAMALAELDRGGYIIAGLIQITNGRSYDAIILRTDADGWVGE